MGARWCGAYRAWIYLFNYRREQDMADKNSVVAAAQNMANLVPGDVAAASWTPFASAVAALGDEYTAWVNSGGAQGAEDMLAQLSKGASLLAEKATDGTLDAGVDGAEIATIRNSANALPGYLQNLG
jgi:hypothetical protein